MHTLFCFFLYSFFRFLCVCVYFEKDSCFVDTARVFTKVPFFLFFRTQKTYRSREKKEKTNVHGSTRVPGVSVDGWSVHRWDLAVLGGCGGDDTKLPDESCPNHR